MKNTKVEWIEVFRNEAERVLPEAYKQVDKKKGANIINNAIKHFCIKIIDNIKITAKME